MTIQILILSHNFDITNFYGIIIKVNMCTNVTCGIVSVIILLLLLSNYDYDVWHRSIKYIFFWNKYIDIFSEIEIVIE